MYRWALLVSLPDFENSITDYRLVCSDHHLSLLLSASTSDSQDATTAYTLLPLAERHRLERQLRRASEFFGTVICRFVMKDLGMLLDKCTSLCSFVTLWYRWADKMELNAQMSSEVELGYLANRHFLSLFRFTGSIRTTLPRRNILPHIILSEQYQDQYSLSSS